MGCTNMQGGGLRWQNRREKELWEKVEYPDFIEYCNTVKVGISHTFGLARKHTKIFILHVRLCKIAEKSEFKNK